VLGVLLRSFALVVLVDLKGFTHRCFPSVSQGKELAGHIKRLPDGTVVFEDIDGEVIRGQVLKTAERRDSPDLVGPTLASPSGTANGNMFGNLIGGTSGGGMGMGMGGMSDNNMMSGKWTPPSSSGSSSMGGPGNPAAQGRAAMLTGRIRYRGKDRSEVEIPFGESDQKGHFTLK
jgi:hypothetical protein